LKAFASFNVGFSLKRDEIPFLNNHSSAEVIVNDTGIGWIGEVRGDVLRL
jgi:phenylalanyl-tRNA synthetase beta subunit